MTPDQKLQLEQAIHDHGAILSFEQSRAGEILLGAIKEELESLKDNADANTVAELKQIKGYKAGLKFLSSVIEKSKRNGELARQQKELQEKRELKNKPPEDSSLL